MDIDLRRLSRCCWHDPGDDGAKSEIDCSPQLKTRNNRGTVRDAATATEEASNELTFHYGFVESVQPYHAQTGTDYHECKCRHQGFDPASHRLP